MRISEVTRRVVAGNVTWWLPLAALVFVIYSFLLPQPIEAQAKATQRIVILNEVGTSYPLTDLVDQGIRTALHNSPYRIEFYREYMETVEFPDPLIQQQFRDLFLHKYENRKPDVIISVGPATIRFMVEVHHRFFPGVPVVFCLPNGLLGNLTLDSDFTGVEGDVSPGATLAAALRLLPDTQHVVVVGGQTEFDRQQQAVAKEQLRIYEDRLDVSYMTDLAMPDLLERLRHLPSHTVVLLAGLGQDATGTLFTSAESGPMVAAAANAPIFSLSDRFLNHGEVGGDVSSVVEQGRVAGGMALRILNGEKPRDVAPLKNSTTYMFDWRALKRWGLKEADLPPGSIVLNRQPTVWDSYKWYIISSISLILLEALLIGGLVWQRARRRKTEAELRQSEEKCSTFFFSESSGSHDNEHKRRSLH